MPPNLLSLSLDLSAELALDEFAALDGPIPVIEERGEELPAEPRAPCLGCSFGLSLLPVRRDQKPPLLVGVEGFAAAAGESAEDAEELLLLLLADLLEEPAFDEDEEDEEAEAPEREGRFFGSSSSSS